MREDVHPGEEARSVNRSVVELGEYSKRKKANRLFCKDPVHEVAPDYEKGYTDQSLFRLSVEDSEWLYVPVGKLNETVDIGHGVQAPGRDLIRPVKFRIAMDHIRLPEDDHSKGQ